MAEQNLLDKTLEEIVEKIDKAGETFEKLIGGEDQNTGRVDWLQNVFKIHHVRNVKKNNDEFSENWKETELDFLWVERVPLLNWEGEMPFS